MNPYFNGEFAYKPLAEPHWNHRYFLPIHQSSHPEVNCFLLSFSQQWLKEGLLSIYVWFSFKTIDNYLLIAIIFCHGFIHNLTKQLELLVDECKRAIRGILTGDTFILREWIWSILALDSSDGLGSSIFRSSRPEHTALLWAIHVLSMKSVPTWA